MSVGRKGSLVAINATDDDRLAGVERAEPQFVDVWRAGGVCSWALRCTMCSGADVFIRQHWQGQRS